MNVSMLIEKLEDKGIGVTVEGCNLRIRSASPLSDAQQLYLKRHKLEIIRYLEASNQERFHRYTYRFTLKDNQGGGTYVTDCSPDKAEQELLDKFLGREIESMELVN